MTMYNCGTQYKLYFAKQFW